MSTAVTPPRVNDDVPNERTARDGSVAPSDDGSTSPVNDAGSDAANDSDTGEDAGADTGTDSDSDAEVDAGEVVVHEERELERGNEEAVTRGADLDLRAPEGGHAQVRRLAARTGEPRIGRLVLERSAAPRVALHARTVLGPRLAAEEAVRGLLGRNPARAIGRIAHRVPTLARSPILARRAS